MHSIAFSSLDALSIIYKALASPDSVAHQDGNGGWQLDVPDDLAGLAESLAANPPAAAASVPAVIKRHQGLIALLLGPGITEQMIRDALATIEDATERELTRLRFEQPDWRRDSEFIAWGAGVFGLIGGQVDQLFISAGGV